MELYLLNNTRYDSKDLEKILLTVSPGDQARQFEWTIDYFQPSTTKPYEGCSSGPFVKLNRNGDESSYRKSIKIVQPGKYLNISDLEQFTFSTSGQAPAECLKEVVHRVQAAVNHHTLSKAPASGTTPLMLRTWRQQTDEIITSNALLLRFTEREPTKAELSGRAEHTTLIRQINTAEKMVTKAKFDLKMHRDDLKRCEAGIESYSKRMEEIKVRIESGSIEEEKSMQELSHALSMLTAFRSVTNDK